MERLGRRQSRRPCWRHQSLRQVLFAKRRQWRRRRRASIWGPAHVVRGAVAEVLGRLGARAMRWMLLIVIATVASICLAEQPEIPGCDHASAVVCFVDHAQAKVRSCLLPTIPLNAAGTNKPQTP